MKSINKKRKLFLALLSLGIMRNATLIHAEGPKFNNDEAQEAVLEISAPATTFFMWLIPIVTAIILLISGLGWLMKDEDEREQKPYKKTAKAILIVAVILESVPVLLRIFGIS